jgi:hypothetical protein
MMLCSLGLGQEGYQLESDKATRGLYSTSMVSSHPAIAVVSIRPKNTAVLNCNRLKRAIETLRVALCDLTGIALD